MRTQKAYKWLRIVLSLLLVLILLALFSRDELRQTILNDLASLSLGTFLLLLGLFSVVRLMQTMLLRLSLSYFGTDLKLGYCANLLGLKGLYNIGITGGGIAAQFAEAKIALGVPARTFFASAALLAVAFIATLLALLSLFSVLAISSPFPGAGWIALGASISLFLLLATTYFAAYSPAGSRLRWRIPVIQKIVRGLSTARAAPATFAWLGSLSVSVHIFRSLRFIVILQASPPLIDPVYSMAAILASDVLAQFPITPGGLGTRELAASLFGSSINAGHSFAAAAIIDRAAAILFNVAHGLLAFVTTSMSSGES